MQEWDGTERVHSQRGAGGGWVGGGRREGRPSRIEGTSLTLDIVATFFYMMATNVRRFNADRQRGGGNRDHQALTAIFCNASKAKGGKRGGVVVNKMAHTKTITRYGGSVATLACSRERKNLGGLVLSMRSFCSPSRRGSR